MADDAPILLGDPAEGDFAAPPADFASPPVDDFASPPVDDFAAPPVDDFAAPPAEAEPAYLGEVNEAPSTDGADPIVLVTSGSDDELVPVEPESTEPSPMQLWSAEWQETLKERKDIENSRKTELVEAARIALEDYAKQREQKRESKMGVNREDEQAKLEAIEADLENDNSWQRVCKMIELSHDSTAEAEDVKRMRDVLILLKNEPARAEALGA